MTRGVGYCENIACEDYLKGVFTMNQDSFHCLRCRVDGFIELEKFDYLNDFPVLREVRVEFDYNPLLRDYNWLAIVTDDELGHQCNSLTVFSPLCKTEKRALKLAELYFAYVTVEGVGANSVNGKESKLSFDDSLYDFRFKLDKMGKKWSEAGELRQKGLPHE
jgi:hypothetical protein